MGPLKYSLAGFHFFFSIIILLMYYNFCHVCDGVRYVDNRYFGGEMSLYVAKWLLTIVFSERA